MCFSATASFTAGTLLLAIGTLTLKAARRTRELPFAAIPILFAIQQLIEGVVWLTFDPAFYPTSHPMVEPMVPETLLNVVQINIAQINVVMTYAYSFFSHVLWPIYIPVAVLLLEPPGGRRYLRRYLLCALVVSGIAVGLYLLYFMVTLPLVSQPVGQHVEYLSPHFFAAATMSLYLLSTTVSPILSMHRRVQIFGVLALLSFGAAYYFYAQWFISVWCFFAAVLSTTILFYLHEARGQSSALVTR